MSNDDFRKTWDTYTSSWKTTSADEKRRLFEASLSPEALYFDPLAETKGWSELVAYMVEFHRQFPGAHFVTHTFIAHHNRSLAHWNMVDSEGNILSDGSSYGLYGEDGKLLQMNGFFTVPE